jgi:hypothetical protein
MPPNDILTPSVEVSIKGIALTIDLVDILTEVVVDKAASAVDRATIRFDISGDEEIPNVVLAADISIAFSEDGTAAKEVFNGEITAVTTTARGDFRKYLQVEAHDKRHRLMRSLVVEAFDDGTMKDLITTIGQRNGLSIDVPGDFTKTKYTSRWSTTTDFATLQKISDDTGYRWTIAGDKLTFRKPGLTGSPTDLTFGDNLIELQMRSSLAERVDEVNVRGWDPSKQQQILGRSDKGIKRYDAKLYADTDAKKSTATSWSHGPIDQQEADKLAEGLHQRLSDSQATGRGRCLVNASIVPLGPVSIKNISAEIDGKYEVTSVRHTFSRDQTTTDFHVGPTGATLAELVAPNTSTQDARSLGVTVGLVTELGGANNKHPGAVKLKLPFISSDNVTGWARLVSQGGATDRGIAFVPEIDDEVLVAFEHGDINRPYVLGTVWGKPGAVFDDTTKDGKVNERRIVSRLLNKLRFIDAKANDDTSGIALEVDDAKTRLFFGYNETTIETTDRPFKLTNGKASITLDKDEITIEASKITLKSSGDVVIDAAKVDMKAKQAIKTDSAQLELKASATAKVESSGMVTIKGSMVKVN